MKLLLAKDRCSSHTCIRHSWPCIHNNSCSDVRVHAKSGPVLHSFGIRSRGFSRRPPRRKRLSAHLTKSPDPVCMCTIQLSSPTSPWLHSRAPTHPRQQKSGILKEPVAKRLMAQLVDGLGYCHSCGVCHRDLKVGARRCRLSIAPI